MSPDVTGSSTRLDMGQFFFSLFALSCRRRQQTAQLECQSGTLSLMLLVGLHADT